MDTSISLRYYSISAAFFCYILRSKMSTMEIAADQHICYTHCNLCNTMLAVTVPEERLMLNTVTVRCGHCANLLPLHLGSLPKNPPLQNFQAQEAKVSHETQMEIGSSSSNCHPLACSMKNDQRRTSPIAPPEKRHRVPSAYNKFIKEEIQRLKASNPTISHKQAFSTAAKNWAHMPHVEVNLEDGN